MSDDKNTNGKPPLTLEDLLADQPSVSKPIPWRNHQVSFRVLSRKQREHCRFAAMAWVVEGLKSAGLGDAYFASLPAQDAFNNEFELRIVEAAMCKENSRGPLTSIDALRATVTPEEQVYLAQHAIAHQELFDPDKIDDERILACIEHAKKNPIGFDTLLEFGMRTLLISFTTLASGLERSMIEESLDGWQSELH